MKVIRFTLRAPLGLFILACARLCAYEVSHFYGPGGIFRDVGDVRSPQGELNKGLSFDTVLTGKKPAVLKLYRVEPGSVRMVPIDRAVEKQLGLYADFYQMQIYSEYDPTINQDVFEFLDAIKRIRALVGMVATPLYLFFKRGELVGMHQGYLELDDFMEMVKSVVGQGAQSSDFKNIESVKRPHSSGVWVGWW